MVVSPGLSHAVYRDAVLMARLFVREDLASYFEAKSALTVGDACRWVPG